MSYPRRHSTAIVGDPPEWRDWKPGMPYHQPVIEESAQVNAYVTVDGGVYGPTRVGARTMLMTKCHVGHDAVIGDDCELSPGVVIGGMCRVGNGVKFGVNSCVRPEVTVGDGARIGAGAVVVKDVPPGETWAGVPAARLGTYRRCSSCGASMFQEGAQARDVLCELCAPLAAVR